jgi:hypothetical protein
MVSTGQGFHKINAPVDLTAGAQVVVSPGGSASIAYTDDCVVAVKPSGIAVIQERTPCVKLPKPMHFGYEEAAVSGDGMGFTPKVGSETKTSSDAPPSTAKKPVYIPTQSTLDDDDDHHDWGTIFLIGGVAVGAGAIALILANQGDDDPVSP